MTRSADRVVPADYGAITLTYTNVIPIGGDPTTISATTNTTTATATVQTNRATATTTTTSNSTTAQRNFRNAENDPHAAVPRGGIDTSRSTVLPSFDRGAGSQAVSASLPAFERAASSQAVTTSFPAFIERSGSSPAMLRNAFPTTSFDRSHSGHASCGGGPEAVAAAAAAARGGGIKRSEIPIKFLSESGHIRSSELIHRVSKGSSQNAREKTLQPSKYGFHRRSKSPTFKRLVAVVEKLQTAAPESDSDSHHSDKCHVCATTASGGVRFPAVPGVSEGAADGDRAEPDGECEEEADSDEEVMVLQPREFLTYIPAYSSTSACTTYRPQVNGGAKTSYTKNKYNNSASASKRHSFQLSSRKGAANGSDARDDPDHDPDLIDGGWGGWEVDSLGLESGVDSTAAKTTMPLGFSPAVDAHTELHLFLPRLADTASEDSGSVAKVSPDRYLSRFLPPEIQTSNSLHRGRAAGPQNIHPRTSHRPPQHPHLNPQQPQLQQQGRTDSGERNGRSQTKRYTSPVRAARRDKTPNKRRAVPSEVYESYEPFLKGEHLKEKLEDFPTLISLDQD